jgi:hypothetical protein
VDQVAEQWQTEKLAFVGESVGLNEYEQQCSLAEDCDLSGGVLRPRLGDFRTTTSAAQRACMVDVGGGTLRWKNSSGYCFAFGDDAYFLNSNGQWTRVKPDGSEQTLQEPAAPTISNVTEYFAAEALSAAYGSWNVNPNPSWPPTWSNISGSISRTFSFSSSKNWKGAAYFWAIVEVPPGGDATFNFFVNGNEVPGRFARADNWFGWLVWDVKSIDCSAINSIGFSYTLSSSHTLMIRYTVFVEYGVPLGQQVYVATRERNGIESVLSAAFHKTLQRPFREIDSTGVSVLCSVPSGQAGDIVRLYRAVGGQYIRVAEYVAPGPFSSVELYDRGDSSEGYYRPSGKLPFGPAVVAGNRAVVAANRTLWVSQAGDPKRFGATAINDDNQDAYTIILPAAIDAITPAEGGVVAHTKRGQYMVALSPSYDNDLLHMRPPVLIDDRAASDHRAAAVGAFISDGRLFVDGQLVVPSGLSNSSWVIRAGGRVYVVSGTTCYVWAPQEWEGAVRWSLPAAAQWVFSYGDDVFVATSNGIYKLAGASSRQSSCRWRTGKRFMPMLSALRFVHVAGDAYSVKLIRPGKPDVTMTNVSGRVNVRAGEQTHEWQLELNVAQSDAVYQCYISYESGIQ